MKKPVKKIGFDLDGTLFRTAEAVATQLGIEHDDDSYKIKGLPSSFWDQNPDFYTGIKAYDGAAAELKRYVEAGYEIFYISSRNPNSRTQTFKALEDNGFPNGPVFLGLDPSDKGILGRFLELTEACGDTIEEMNSYAEYGIPCRLVSHGYNRGCRDRFMWPEAAAGD